MGTTSSDDVQNEIARLKMRKSHVSDGHHVCSNLASQRTLFGGRLHFESDIEISSEEEQDTSATHQQSDQATHRQSDQAIAILVKGFKATNWHESHGSGQNSYG